MGGMVRKPGTSMRRVAATVVAAAFVAATSLAPAVGHAEGVTADGVGSGGGRRAARSVTVIPAAGRAGVPAEAAAVTMTMTVVDATTSGFATVWPCGQPQPNTSTLNFTAGVAASNTTVSGVGIDGAVCVYVSASVHLVADIAGWFPAGAAVVSAPSRLVDTRAAEGFPAHGLTRVTSRGETAKVWNVTVVDPIDAGFVTVWPCEQRRPVASSANFVAGQTVANTVIVTTGEQCVYASAPAEIVVDDTGVELPSGFAGTQPTRLVDTRRTAGPVPAAKSVRVPFQSDSAAVLNVTVVDAVAPGFVTVWPCDDPRPSTSNVNFGSDHAVANMVIVAGAAGSDVCLWSNVEGQVVVDLEGELEGFMAVPAARLLDTRGGHYVPVAATGCTTIVPTAPLRGDAVQIGVSRLGRSIVAESYGDPNGVPVLIVGPVHGDECSALAVVEHIRAAAVAGGVPPGVRLVVIPTMNPDGIVAGTRTNAGGVDLNRDAVDLVAPESRVLLEFTAGLQPAVAIHLHSPYGWTAGAGGNGIAHWISTEIAKATGLVQYVHPGREPGMLWNAQADLVPGLGFVLVETPSMAPFDAAQFQPIPGAPTSSPQLIAATAATILSAVALVAR